jgi:acetyltransferase-like isoleucine patch superfamily enzyme
VGVAPIRIGNNVWIGRNALIFPGVDIGDHSVIGAGSIVTRSIPDRSVAVGNPARPIKRLSASDGFVRR